MRAFFRPETFDAQRLWTAAQPVLAALGVIIAIVAAVIGATNASKSDTDGSSKSDAATTIPACENYTPPPLDVHNQLTAIQQELYQGIFTWRQEEASVPVVSIDPQLQVVAQRQAECNAVNGTQPGIAIDAPVATISAYLPADKANAYEFFELIRNSKKHSDIVVDGRHNYYAIGTAYGKDKVWMVMAFSANGL